MSPPDRRVASGTRPTRHPHADGAAGGDRGVGQPASNRRAPLPRQQCRFVALAVVCRTLVGKHCYLQRRHCALWPPPPPKSSRTLGADKGATTAAPSPPHAATAATTAYGYHRRFRRVPHSPPPSPSVETPGVLLPPRRGGAGRCLPLPRRHRTSPPSSPPNHPTDAQRRRRGEPVI